MSLHLYFVYVHIYIYNKMFVTCEDVGIQSLWWSGKKLWKLETRKKNLIDCEYDTCVNSRRMANNYDTNIYFDAQLLSQIQIVFFIVD